ncbi:MAG TPA: hypothetical protein VEX38_03295, partial [Fimbriimonadaceae bacterium]|nr:hypothetical protein [Fimbriimonadaceae bacterium]
MGSDLATAQRLALRADLVKELGDDPAYAVRARAVGERLKGLWARSAESFIEAGRLARSPVDKLAFQTGAVDSLARAARIEEGVKLGQKLFKGLRALGEHQLAGRVALNLGNALAWADRYTLSRKWLRTAVAELPPETYEHASAKLTLSTLELEGGHPADARRLAEGAREEYTELGLSHYANLASINLAHEALMRGRADEALDLLLSLRPAFQDSPADLARIAEFMGDAYLRLNLYEEALDSFNSALKHRVQRHMPLNRANSHYGAAMALLHLDEPSLSARSFAKAASMFNEGGNQIWSATAKVGRAQVLRLRGKMASAKQLVDEAQEALWRAGSPYHRTLAMLEAAECAHEAGENISRSIAYCRRHVRQFAYAGLLWRVHALEARAASEARRLSAYRAMFEAILQARSLTDSTVGRAAFLRDKSRALSGYLEALLEAPSPRNVREAVDVIRRSRSAALLDEVLGAREGDLPESVIGELQELRQELSLLAEDSPSAGGSRSALPVKQKIDRIQRRWIETTRKLSSIVAPELLPSGADGVVVFAEAGESYFALRDE